MALFRPKYVVTCLKQLTIFMLQLKVNILQPFDERTLWRRAKREDLIHWAGSGRYGL